MADNRRESPRFSVSLYAESREPVESEIHILNLSATGFLVRGDVLAGHGGVLHASFRIKPSSGDMRISVRGKVMHSHIAGANSEFGVKIEGFGNSEEEKAYLDYVRELAQRAEARSRAD